MQPGRRPRNLNGSVLGVVLTALSLLHTPLPQADFHTIRHHDQPGELCDHHDHLLRWHPGAGTGPARDVAVLHWHWFLATQDGHDPVSEGEGTAIHAHVPDWAAVSWDGPTLQVPAEPRHDFRAAADSQDYPALSFLTGLDDPNPPPLSASATPSRAPFARRASLTSLLHRWVC